MCRPAAASADARLAWARAALREAAEELASLDPAELSEGALGEGLLDLLRVRRQLEGASAVVGDRFAHSSEWAADGARDAVAWVRGRTQEGFGSVRAVLATGRSGATFRLMGQALREGEVGVRHVAAVDAVARAFPRLVRHLQLAEAQVVDLARESEPAVFQRSLTALCHRLDPMAAAEDARAKEREFFLHASTMMDGHVRVDGMLPADVGQLLIAALESARRTVDEMSDRDPTADGGQPALDIAVDDGQSVSDPMAGVRTPEADIFGTPVDADPIDVRLRGQRNVEALQRILIAASGAEGVLPSVAGSRPQVNVTVSVDTLAAEPGEGVDCGWLERFGVPTQPITADTARRLSCDASLRPLIVDAHGQLVAFGTASRVIPPPMRALVVRRDRHCRFAGCRARIDEVHHVVFFSRGGPTTSSNLLGLCWFHHHLVHEGGWDLVGDANIEIKGTGPDGRMWVTGPPGG